jgi:predicted 3-demethylubiquinone-9 3-methyltransferase (glyoxalase superfamily)
MTKQKIVPHLWFDTQAVEAAEFYTTVFPDSKVTMKNIIKDTPSGDCDIVAFEVWGFKFMAISAGPIFTMNPSISFFVNFEATDNDPVGKLNATWEKLADGGKVLMELQEYPWSKRYGWVQDKYGVSWQLILTNPEGDARPRIVPSLLFTGKHFGQAEEAAKYWCSIFKDGKMGNLMHYGPGQEPNKEGTVMFSDFLLGGTWLVAMDGPGEHAFEFNEGISLIVDCADQAEIDYFWEKLSAVPEAEQCGWVKDQFGVSWQIVPQNMDELMATNPEASTKAMLAMKKIDIQALKDEK